MGYAVRIVVDKPKGSDHLRGVGENGKECMNELNGRPSATQYVYFRRVPGTGCCLHGSKGRDLIRVV